MRRIGSLAVVLIAAAALLAPTQAPAAPRGGDGQLDVYRVILDRGDVALLGELGADRRDIRLRTLEDGRVEAELIMSSDQAERLSGRGVTVTRKRIDGDTVAQRATERAEDGFEVWRRYEGRRGIRADFVRTARRHPRITELVTIGTSVQGRDIIALRVTRGARKIRDGRRPAVLYVSAQHAREWITPEMVTRLMHHVVDGYSDNRRIRKLVKNTELWFVPVANPDGYEFTFEPGQRLWRKNLRDNNGNGTIETGDGVDLNRNFPTRWGYDNEGSSPNPSDETYRGPAPASEPETRALIRLSRRVGFEFFVNYHSAAELLLYGTGWQVATPGPDDVLYETMVGDDDNPAVPGYDPDISAELYTTNGDTDTHLTEAFDTLGFTPEMSTCEAVSAADPDDEWDPENCGSGFEFPDDEELVQQEFERNLPFALSVARSADDPDDPESVLDREAPDFRVDKFRLSYGSPQTVAVHAKRALRGMKMRYRIDGRVHTRRVFEWRGGERYGAENDVYYAEYRGRVRGASPGDRVTVWFVASDHRERTRSKRFTYTVASNTGHDVLVIANEDYTGVDPDYPPEVTSPKYAERYLDAVRSAGFTADLWDVDAQGIPHDLGVLSHYDGIVWYLGDNRLTQDPEDALTTTPLGDLPDLSVAERQHYLTLAVRDFLNEGGKLVHVGESAMHQGFVGISDAIGGLYYGLNGDPSAECVITTSFRDDCLLYADDFRQYYLGGYTRTDRADPAQVEGVAPPFTGFVAEFGGPDATPDNPLDEAGVYQVTSDALPVDEFPQFASRGTLVFPPGDEQLRFLPVEGDRFAGATHADASYLRLTRTATIPAGAEARLDFQVSVDVEEAYDHLIVEARTAGGDDWTTLPETGGLSTTTPPAECEAGGFLLAMHPFLEHYLGGDDCTAPGTTGTWHSITGVTDGWQQVSYDLSAYAGSEVEVSITYVTDPAFGGIGVFVDDTHVVIDGTDDADGFEDETSAWTPAGPPVGSPPNFGNWEFASELVFQYTGVATEDTHLFGFGIEQLSSEAQQHKLTRRALIDLLGGYAGSR